MTRRAAAALLLLLAVLLVLAVIAPPAHSDQSVAATAVPASEFIPIEPAVTPAPSVHSASITPASATPVPSLAPVPRLPAVRVLDVASVTGQASWYRYVPGGAAAGPRLRSALGPGWRGSVVRVCSGACVVVTLSDFMRADRLIDLDVRSWAAICGDPSGGLCRVEVTP
jgi:hypothetical protein